LDGSVESRCGNNWYWLSFNETGHYAYDYKEMGAWRDNGPYPNVMGNIQSFTVNGNWWTAKVAISVESNGSFAFAPEFAAYDENSNEVMSLVSDSPTVFLPQTDTIVTLHGKRLNSNDTTSYHQIILLLSIDFWAGQRLIMPVSEKISVA
jgi:hypothetical protein